MSDIHADPEAISTITRLGRDLKLAAVELGPRQARYLVDAYYAIQEERMRYDKQSTDLGAEPHALIDYLGEQARVLENQIRLALDHWTRLDPVSIWARSIVGIGPVISAGLRAHIDITRAPTAGHIWSFAGLVPGVKWEKGQKRPWNAGLKTLCWKAGESFVKTCNHKDSYYGRVYAERKQLEIKRNDSGELAAQAAERLPSYKRASVSRAALEAGKLSDGMIHARARRYAVKLFLAHYHEVAYKHHYKETPPNPYPIAILGHVHRIPPPS